jgi:predicted acyl esterase
MIFEKNVDIPLKDGGLCRGNVYKPKAHGRYPVIMTCESSVPPRRRANSLAC